VLPLSNLSTATTPNDLDFHSYQRLQTALTRIQHHLKLLNERGHMDKRRRILAQKTSETVDSEYQSECQHFHRYLQHKIQLAIRLMLDKLNISQEAYDKAHV
jgi:hypothetical protein